MSDFSALHVAASGLRAAQVKMDTASNNISNANTVGYTRQRVELSTRFPHWDPAGQLGTGVEVTDIIRIRDQFLDGRVRSAVASLAETDVRADLLARAELVMGEPDLGVTSALDALWSSFEDLALDPTDRGARQAMLQQLDALAVRIRDISADLGELRSGAIESLDSVIADANTELAEIARLNVVILDAAAEPGTPNDLLDQRDRLIDSISESIGATATFEDDGSVRVSLNGMALVSGADSRSLSVDLSTGDVLHPSGVAVTPGGTAGGHRVSITTDLPNLVQQLDAFASDLANALNAVHQAGYTPSGPGGALLGFDPAAPSASIEALVTDPEDVATAAAPGPPFAPFDATVIEQLADLRTATVAAGGTLSIGESYRSIVTSLGQSTASALGSAASQQGLVEAVQRSRESAHGVSVDEEMVALMEAQRMYEAAARVITSVDQALDTVINRMGVVGR